MKLRYIAPAGAPLQVQDLVRTIGGLMAHADPGQRLTEAVKARFGVHHVELTSTGRAGLVLLLRALRRLAPGRDEVVLPSYTCYSVAASIVKAGLRLRVVDISPETLDYSKEELEGTDFTRVLAIIATNLYGMPNDMPSLSRIARRRGVFLIDDAAQAMGAQVGGRLCGTWGDAGLFSLDKGKNISAVEGGMVVTSSPEVAEALKAEADSLQSTHRSEATRTALKAAVYWLFLRPSLYWIPNRMAWIGLGKTVFDTRFPVGRLNEFSAALGATMLERLESFTAGRVARAARVLEAVEGSGAVRAIRPGSGARPAYLRLPLLAASHEARGELLQSLNAAGIGATASYPAAIPDVPDLRRHGDTAVPYRWGRYVADRILTLPTHSYVTADDLREMARQLRIVRLVRSVPAPDLRVAL